MNREDIDANLRENKAVRDEVIQLISSAFGATSIREVASALGAHHKTVLAVLDDPDRYAGERPKAGRPSTGGASAYEIHGRVGAAARIKSKDEVLAAIRKILN